MNNRPSIISPVRPSRFGDLICSLPTTYYFNKKYPDCYQCAFIDISCAQIVPLLLNQPYIDRIVISEKRDVVTEKEQEFWNKFDLQFPAYNHYVPPNWWNYISVQEQTFRLNYLSGKGYISENEWQTLTEEEKCPKLVHWLDPLPRFEKTISLWPESGYANFDPTIKQRSPSREWWNDLICDLTDLGYKVNQYGHPKAQLLNGCVNRLNLNLFDAVRESLACEICITTDSGSGHILNAYGKECICLYTNWRENHRQNFSALCPVNWKNNLIKIFGKDNINNIDQEEVIQAIKQFNL